MWGETWKQQTEAGWVETWAGTAQVPGAPLAQVGPGRGAGEQEQRREGLGKAPAVAGDTHVWCESRKARARWGRQQQSSDTQQIWRREASIYTM